MGIPRLHLFEPTGFGGIFQHTCALAELMAGNGYDVTLHTSAQHEDVTLERVRPCRCMWWPRDGRLRQPRIAARYMTRGLAHLDRAAGEGSVVHLQGGQASGVLAAATMAVARRRNRRAVFSPHNTFSRGGRVDAAFQRRCIELADALIGYSQADVRFLARDGGNAWLSPLIQLVPEPSQEAKAAWRRSWGVADGDQVVIFAGQIRPDKRLDLLVESAARWPAARRLAVVGEDRGAWAQVADLASRLGVEISATVGFVPLPDFTAAIATADVLVAPYDRASQSGVLSLARQLGVGAVASDIGGLAELASRTFPPGDVDALTEAVERELAEGRSAPSRLDESLALRAHLGAYGWTETSAGA